MPIVPGTTEPVDTVEAARKIAETEIGYPVAVKAAGGGGGKGFRVALTRTSSRTRSRAPRARARSSSPTRRSTSSATCPTRATSRSRSSPTRTATSIHLGERDCSIQRRHQKLIEESPAPRRRRGAARADRQDRASTRREAVSYRGAGTIEGLCQDGEYFFLEMNTRVQVEHCVTEMTTGIDIVKEGIRAAAGEPLLGRPGRRRPARPRDRVPHQRRGRVEELRPRARPIGDYVEPCGPRRARRLGRRRRAARSRRCTTRWSRKLIVWDADREQATQRMLRALGEYEIEGLKTLIPFHTALLRTEQWARARDVPRPPRGQGWLKSLALPDRPSASTTTSPRRSSRTYTVEVSAAGASTSRSSGRRSRGGGGRRRGGAAAARASPARRAQVGRRGGGPDTLESPMQGNVWKVARRAGRRRRGGPARLHHRGDEDGERDHRPQVRHDRELPITEGAAIAAGDTIALIVSLTARGLSGPALRRRARRRPQRALQREWREGGPPRYTDEDPRSPASAPCPHRLGDHAEGTACDA